MLKLGAQPHPQTHTGKVDGTEHHAGEHHKSKGRVGGHVVAEITNRHDPCFRVHPLKSRSPKKADGLRCFFTIALWCTTACHAPCQINKISETHHLHHLVHKRVSLQQTFQACAHQEQHDKVAQRNTQPMRQAALHAEVHTRSQQHHVVRSRRDGSHKGKHGHGRHQLNIEVHECLPLGHCV